MKNQMNFEEWLKSTNHIYNGVRDISDLTYLDEHSRYLILTHLLREYICYKAKNSRGRSKNEAK